MSEIDLERIDAGAGRNALWSSNMPQLERFEFLRNPQSGDLRLMVAGSTLYQGILKRAFPKIAISHAFESQGEKFQWGCYLKRVGARDEERLRLFCRLLQKAILIHDDLDECFALGMHSELRIGGPPIRAEFGELVYQAKSYNRDSHAGSREMSRRLAVRLARFVKAHPTYGRADIVVPVPPSNPDKDFDLPTLLAQEVSSLSGVSFGIGVVRKTRLTSPMKSCLTEAEKLKNVRGAYLASSSAIGRGSVILVDDIYQSGATLNEIARALRKAGAAEVLGLVATKTLKGVRP